MNLFNNDNLNKFMSLSTIVLNVNHLNVSDINNQKYEIPPITFDKNSPESCKECLSKIIKITHDISEENGKEVKVRIPECLKKYT